MYTLVLGGHQLTGPNSIQLIVRKFFSFNKIDSNFTIILLYDIHTLVLGGPQLIGPNSIQLECKIHSPKSGSGDNTKFFFFFFY